MLRYIHLSGFIPKCFVFTLNIAILSIEKFCFAAVQAGAAFRSLKTGLNRLFFSLTQLLNQLL